MRKPQRPCIIEVRTMQRKECAIGVKRTQCTKMMGKRVVCRSAERLARRTPQAPSEASLGARTSMRWQDMLMPITPAQLSEASCNVLRKLLL